MNNQNPNFGGVWGPLMPGALGDRRPGQSGPVSSATTWASKRKEFGPRLISVVHF